MPDETHAGFMLTDSLFSEAEAVGHRLRACLGEVVRVGVGARAPANEIAKALRVDGVIARKLVKMLSTSRGGADVVAQSPKPAQLSKIAEHVSSRREHLGISEADAWALKDAIKKLERLIEASGGSKMTLTRAIRAQRDSGATVSGEGGYGRDEPVRLVWAIGDDVVRGEAGGLWGVYREINPVEDEAAVVAAVRDAAGWADGAGASCVLIPSGRFLPSASEEVGGDDTRGDTAWLAASRTWGPAGFDALAASLGPGLDEAAYTGVRVLLLPAVGDSVGDAQRFSALIRRLGAQRAAHLGAVLDAGRVLEGEADRAVRADRFAGLAAGLGEWLAAVVVGGEDDQGLAEGLPTRVAVIARTGA